MKNIEDKLNNLKKFDKEDRSTFPYWYEHWKAFNLVAKQLGAWKIKYIFHDWYKPWLKLFIPYEKVQSFHRKHARHHLEWLENKFKNCEECLFFSGYKYMDNLDVEAMVIDWESNRYTKLQHPETAYEKYHLVFQRENFKEEFPELYHQGCFMALENKVFNAIEKLKLNEE